MSGVRSRQRFERIALVIAGLLLVGCGEDVCTSVLACPAGPSQIPSHEQWRLAGDAILTLSNAKLGEQLDVPLGSGELDFLVGSFAETCDTTTSSVCSHIDVMLTLRLPGLEHHDPETGELTFVTMQPEVTAFGTMTLEMSSPEENVFRAMTFDVRTCSALQSKPPNGALHGQGHRVSWTSELEFHASRRDKTATLRFSGLPLTLTSNDASCDAFALGLSGELTLER